MGAVETSEISAEEARHIKVLCTLPGEAGGEDLAVCVLPNRKLLLARVTGATNAEAVGRAVSLAEAELMATAVLAGDAYITTHPHTLHAVCLALVAAKARREAAAARAASAPAAREAVS